VSEPPSNQQFWSNFHTGEQQNITLDAPDIVGEAEEEEAELNDTYAAYLMLMIVSLEVVFCVFRDGEIFSHTFFCELDATFLPQVMHISYL
jgi:hypothetical protein